MPSLLESVLGLTLMLSLAIHWYNYNVKPSRDQNLRIPDFIPLDSRITYDEKTTRVCVRCAGRLGHIIRKRRFKVCEDSLGNKTVKELTSLFSCNRCSYRGISLHNLT